MTKLEHLELFLNRIIGTQNDSRWWVRWLGFLPGLALILLSLASMIPAAAYYRWCEKRKAAQ